MNCLTEALGLSLPGNGTMLATHSDRRQLFERAGELIVELSKRYYEEDDASVLPRSIACKPAFNNAMALDIAMGGSTNTILHLIAIALEGEIDFDMADIDDLSRKIPQLCKVAPNSPKYHVEDVHRAGGRFSGGTSGLSIGHVSPEAASGGEIGLVQNGDIIKIDIPNRTIDVQLSDKEFAARRLKQDSIGWKPVEARPRKVSTALKAYALLATSANKGAVRSTELFEEE